MEFAAIRAMATDRSQTGTGVVFDLSALPVGCRNADSDFATGLRNAGRADFWTASLRSQRAGERALLDLAGGGSRAASGLARSEICAPLDETRTGGPGGFGFGYGWLSPGQLWSAIAQPVLPRGGSHRQTRRGRGRIQQAAVAGD